MLNLEDYPFFFFFFINNGIVLFFERTFRIFKYTTGYRRFFYKIISGILVRSPHSLDNLSELQH